MATMTLSDMIFQNYASKVAILITSSGTYTLDNCFFDQSGTYDIEIDSGVTGDTTIVLTNGTTALVAGDVDNNGSGALTIELPVTCTVTGLPSTCEATWVKVSDGTELYHVETVGGTGIAAYTYNYASDIDVNILLHDVTNNVGDIDGITLGNTDQSLPATYSTDRVFNDPA